NGCWRGRCQIGVRKLVIQVQRDKGFVLDAQHALNQQLEPPGLDRIKGSSSRNFEQGGFFEVRGIGSFHAGQTLVVQIGEVKAVQILDDLDTAKNPAAYIT